MQAAMIALAVVFFLIPFGLWVILRFREKVNQVFAPWHKPVLIGSFVVCLIVCAALIAVDITVIA